MSDKKDQYDANAKNEAMDRLSRAIAELGVDTMRNLGNLSVLVIGCRGVGVETAKNVILGSCKAVSVWDPEITLIEDLGCNFYLRPEHVGKVARAKASIGQLAELNPYVSVECYEGALSEDFLKKFGAVVVTVDLPKTELLRINKFCHGNSITFLLALTHGVSCSFFSDFGPEHVVCDWDGEPTQTLVVENISSDGTVTCSDSHGLDDGDMVMFTELEGIEALNNMNDVKVKRMYQKVMEPSRKDPEVNEEREVLVPNKFCLDLKECKIQSFEKLGKWKVGGICQQVKPKKLLSFRPLEESLSNPCVEEMHQIFGVFHMDQERWQLGVGSKLHIAYLAMLEFQSKHNYLPRLHSDEDAAECIQLAKQIMAKHQKSSEALVCDVDEKIITNFTLYCRVELPGFCAFLGGVAAQEIIKRFGKYTPMRQWMHAEYFELLQDTVPADASPVGSRYDHQIAVFGKYFQIKIGKQKWFLVGAGALGCEFLKGIAMMGIGSQPGGLITITDMDRIELSNLSRQFLFRNEHVAKPKSKCASLVAKTMNPDLNLTTLEMKVCPETEDVFNDVFWDSLDGVWNALDNVQARKYTDKQCLLHHLPLLESGTQGTKANSEIIIPYQTTSYSDHKDQETGGIAACTLRNFPHLIVHCIEYAKPFFQELFELAPTNFNAIVSDKKKFLDKVRNSGNAAVQLDTLRSLKELCDNAQKRTMANCITMAFKQFVAQYRTRIQDLIHFFPEESRMTEPNTKADLGPFWAGHKRFPLVAEYNLDEPLHLEFIYNTANLYAVVMGLKPIQSMAEMKKLALGLKLKVPAWKVPTKGIDLEEESNEEKKDEPPTDENEEKELTELYKFFEKLDTKKIKPLVPQEFEKDDDTNFHVDFITVASNLRAWNYKIQPTTRLNAKVVAGKIIAALATTTAMITGLVELEFYKLALNLPQSLFRNANVNLAIANFNLFDCTRPHKTLEEKVVNEEKEERMIIPYPRGFTTWDQVLIDRGDLTCEEFAQVFKEVHYNIKLKLLFKHGITQQDVEDGLGQVLFNNTAVPRPTTMQETMLKRKNLAEATRQNFQNQLDYILKANKDIEIRKKSKVSELYFKTYGPLVTNTRNYLLLTGDFEDADGNEAVLPVIKYVFRH